MGLAPLAERQAHSDPGLTPAAHGSKRPRCKTLHVHNLTRVCAAYLIVLNPTRLWLSHYFRMNETQLFTWVLWAYEFPPS